MFLMIFGIVLVAFWLYNLAHHDYKNESCIESEDECNTCPFPCDKRKNLKGDSNNHEN